MQRRSRGRTIGKRISRATVQDIVAALSSLAGRVQCSTEYPLRREKSQLQDYSIGLIVVKAESLRIAGESL